MSPRSVRPLLAAALLAAACSPTAPSEPDSTGTTQTDTPGTTDLDPSTDTTTPTSTTSTTTGTSEASGDTDGPTTGDPIGCSILTEEPCSPTEKCMPLPPQRGHTDLTCVPIVEDPAGLDEQCQHLEVQDTCARHLACIDGTCRPRCDGTPDAPTCPGANMFCDYFGTYSICEDICDPRAPQCPEARPMCSRMSGRFACEYVLGPIMTEEYDDCTYPAQCGPGLICAFGYCNAACDVDTQDCPSAAQNCVGYNPPIVGLEDLGLCADP